MNYKQLEKEIKQALDNLENVKMTNTLKATAILEAIKPLLTTDSFLYKPVSLRKRTERTN